MRLFTRLAALAAATATLVGAASSAQAISAACTNFRGTIATGMVQTGIYNGTNFEAGEVLSFTFTTATGTETVGLENLTTATVLVPRGAVSFSYTIPATTSNLISLIGTYNSTTVAAWSCRVGSSGSPLSQSIGNAQAAIQNGQQSMQNYNDWVNKGVMGSFGIGGSTGGSNTALARLASVSAEAKVRRLQTEERAIVEERAELAAGDERAADLDRRLADTRRDLAYARSTADISTAPSERLSWRTRDVAVSERTALAESMLARERMMQRDNLSPAQQLTYVHEGPTGNAPRESTPTPTMSYNARNLIDACGEQADGGANACAEMLGKRWNIWAEARAIGVTDSLAASNALGFVGSTGVDYKFMPWLAVGMSLGIEGFETKYGTAGLRSGTIGLTAMPYVGVRLEENIYASAFVGLTSINYNNNPSTAVSARFAALRFMFGGAVSGVWNYGAWRLQPTLQGTYGTETQYGYTDSVGTVVAGQVVNYGRISAGPEVGYSFQGPDKQYRIEPFVLAKINLDFASTNAVALNGQAVALRPGTLGSGSAGAGVAVNFESSFYLRLQGSYDSIGVSGLDVWSGLIRGGMTF